MSKFTGFIMGAAMIGAGLLFLPAGVGLFAATTAARMSLMLVIEGGAMIAMQAIVDLTSQKAPSREASEMSLALGEQPRVMLVGETFTPGSLVDGFDYGGKYGTDWEVLIIRLADHKCHSLTGFFVNDDWNPYVSDGLVPRYDDQLKIYFRADTSSIGLPSIVTDNGPGWTSADIGQSGCDVIVAYKADKEQDKHPGWPGGRPRFGFVVKGGLWYDPRKDDTVPGGSGPHRWDDPSTREWTENAVVCWYNYERGVFSDDDTSDPTKLLVGRGLSAEESPPEYIFAAANLCDELIPPSYPIKETETPVAFDPMSMSPDGTMLYTVSSGTFSAINLAKRSLYFSVTATGASGGSAATNDGAYFFDSSGSLFFGSRTATVTKLIDHADLGMDVGGIGLADGDVWVYPFNVATDIGHLPLSGGAFTVSTVNFTTTQVFTSATGDAIAVGTTSGNILAIGPAGSTGTLINTSAYGTSGPVYAFDNGTNYVVWQGNHLFLISKGGTPAIVASVAVSTLLRVAEGFAMTKPGAGSFWLDGVEFVSSDLSTIRTIDVGTFTGGGTPGGGLVYDPVNHALMVTTSGPLGVGFALLDRNGSYRVAGPIYSTQPFIDVEQMFASATAGAIVTRDGAVELEPGAAKSVVATFSDADLVVGSKVSWNQGFLSESSDDWVNTVVTQYIEPDQNWNSHASPALRSEADIIADGKPREQQVTLRLVRYQEQALRIAEIGRRLGRLWGRGTVTLGPRFCEIEDNDWISWQSDRYFGGATKTFRVDAYSIDEKWQNMLNLREINGAAFAADGVYPIDYSRATATPPPPDTGSPDSGNWSLAAITMDSGGVSVPALEVTGSAADDIYAEAIIVEYWLDDGSIDPAFNPDGVTWISAGRFSPDTTKVDITSVTGGETYYAAVTYVVGGVSGERLVLGPVTLSDFSTGTSGGPVGTPGLAFRVYVDSNNGHGISTAVREAQLLDESGTPITGGTAFQGGSGSDNGSGVNAPWDGNSATTWSRSSTTATFFGKKFTTSQSVASVKLTCDDPTKAPLRFRLQTSNDTTNGTDGTWIDIFTAWEPSWNAAGNDRTHPQDTSGGKFKAFGWLVTANNGDRFYYMNEAEMHAVVGGSDICTGGGNFASDQTGTGSGPDYLFDNNTASGFAWDTAATPTQVPGSVGYAFPVPISKPVEYVLTQNSSTARSWATWTFAGTNDGLNWTNFDARSGVTWSATPQTKTFAVP